ncbi:MAG: hemolysin family protein [Candidatus Micrarchaeota archaeon]|nr:hemolysin family protein [Candidatus Micrarchaeota archaeon]
MDPLTEALLLLVLLAISAFFAAIEVAFLSISRVRLHSLVEKKVKGADSIMRLRNHRRKVIIALIIGTTVVTIAISALATAVAIDAFGDTGVGIAVGAITFIVLVFGEIAPKSFATTHGEQLMLTFAPLTEAFYWLTYPLIMVFELINRLIPGAYSRATGIEQFSEEDVRSAVKLGAQHKSITQKEKQLIENVLAFEDRTVAQAMTPRNRVVALDGKLMVPEAHKKALEGSEYSRFPVMMDGKVVGVVTAKIMGKALYQHPDWHLSKIAWEPLRFRTITKAHEAFAKMQDTGRNIAIVENEKGEFVGVVTLEDLLEEIVGEIK